MKDKAKRIMAAGNTAHKNKLAGMMDARPGLFRLLDSPYSNGLYMAQPDEDRVQVITNGGGGYGPLFSGFIGPGLADGSCEGNFDTAPNAYSLYELAKIAGAKHGVLYIANNFAGDFLNNDMAQELLRGENIDALACYASDDIFSARGEPVENRGGLSGVGNMIKIAAYAAEQKLPLKEVYGITKKANSRLKSLSVQMNPDTRMSEFGTGFSGEPPVEILPYEGPAPLVKQAIDFLLPELNPAGDEVIYLTVNRMCEMSYTEGYGLLHLLKDELVSRGYTVGGCVSGQYYDSYDGNGALISLLAADGELRKYIRYVSGYDFTV